MLSLVQRALDEIDDHPVSVTARRTARIAVLLGETELAVRLGFELKPGSGGHPPSNASDTRRLMADPSTWGQADSPAEAALAAYMATRRIPDQRDKIDGHSLSQLEAWVSRLASDDELSKPEILEMKLRQQHILDAVQHTCFTALCSWERRLGYANINEDIFLRFKSSVDALLSAGAPDVLDQFAAVHRRLRDAAASAPDLPLSEDVAQAVTTCRRILKAVADHLLPGLPGARSSDGRSLNDASYKNRLYEWVKVNVASDTSTESVKASIGGIFERFSALDQLASKGVHASVGLQEAELCAISTYLAAGELLQLSLEIQN